RKDAVLMAFFKILDLVSLELHDQGAGSRIPELEAVVVAGTDDLGAVRGMSHAVDLGGIGGGMGVDLLERNSLDQVEDANLAVVAAAGNLGSVLVEGHRIYQVGMREVLDGSRGVQLPGLHLLVQAAGKEGGVVGREDHIGDG